MLPALALFASILTMGNPSDNPSKTFHKWAATPPMGWNSWDCFGVGVTEDEVRENAAYMAKHLKPHGWKLITVDIEWFISGVRGWNYTPDIEIHMDAYGRPIPATDRFPSAKDGKGFTALAAWTHAQGLKFGVHLLRGIPRKAVEKNLPILGTKYHAADIADKNSICPWNPDMYGVDMSKPGAQEYYDSLIKLMADWGIDFIKVDDLSRPYHTPEIEAIRKAIDKTGRAIVFSTSPGETPVAEGAHVADHANMWRISDDFWDNWEALKEQFARLNAWTPYRGPGHWPDADMLPLAAVRQGQTNSWTNFTHDEQYTLMSLWAIARSPLILGGHLPKNDDFTLKLITNDAVLQVNQHSTNNRQLFRRGDEVAWLADVPGSKDKYLAVFNAANQWTLDPTLAKFESPIVTRSTPGQAVDIDVDVTGAKKLYLEVDDAGDGFAWDHAVWMNPTLTGANGETKLTSLKWVKATAGWGAAGVNRAVSGLSPVVNGQPVADGIGTHAHSIIEFDLPAGVTRFQAKGGLEKASADQKDGGTLRFRVYTQDPNRGQASPTKSISVAVRDLGLGEAVRVKELWTGQDLGVVKGTLNASVRWHGATLYRVSPAKP